MLTMDTTDTHMPTMVTTMARDLLMLSQRLMLMPTTDMLTHMPMVLDMPTMVTTMARDLLMLSQRLMLMLTTGTTHMPMDTISDMPTMDTTDTHMPTAATDTTTKM